MKADIILASSSYMKNFIMERSHLKFRAVDPDIDESQYDHMPMEQRVLALAIKKAKTVVSQHPKAFVIAADTLTKDAETGAIYGKPSNLQKQYEQALSMSGKSIVLVTGTAIYFEGKELEATTTETTIKYQQFDKTTYDRLTHDDNPHRRSSVLGMFIDSAGFTLIESIHGSYTGAMGLPMEVVYRNLRKIS